MKIRKKNVSMRWLFCLLSLLSCRASQDTR